jgi:hypothetical protein
MSQYKLQPQPQYFEKTVVVDSDIHPIIRHPEPMVEIRPQLDEPYQSILSLEGSNSKFIYKSPYQPDDVFRSISGQTRRHSLPVERRGHAARAVM